MVHCALDSSHGNCHRCVAREKGGFERGGEVCHARDVVGRSAGELEVYESRGVSIDSLCLLPDTRAL